ncbi:hypothetical protein HPG69_003178 [Diceros bicornis minor]|uniref:E3 ubiquitin-protein ligase RNF135 n=1 Tax=Diceros bicornis minor TaxID=77932 RepID=A0A7J7EKE9_DICBM|nr:hypothetical protein HPG69_003178 [Diceros bicornis minor]
MTGLDTGRAIPVWLAEDDLGCIICHGLLAWPVTLPCGHTFCRSCLKDLWGAGAAGRRWSCPTCREGGAQQLQLRKNTLLQDLADNVYSSLCLKLVPGASFVFCFALLKAAAQKSITEVGRELSKLVEQVVDIIKSLQSQRHLPESGPDNDLSVPSTAFSGGVDLSLSSPKLVTSNTPERKKRDILHDLEEIQQKLQESFTWKAVLEEQTQGAISPTFDMRSLSCSLEISEDHRTVTVSHCLQSYSWSRERFSTCQVLCSQAFSSGHQYWEVDTQHCSHWAVGVASWGMSRDHILGRTKDSWCVEWKGTSQLSAWHMVKETILGSDRPKVVGIWLDLEERKLAFYSVANQKKLLYECPISASSPLHPAFWLYGLRPGNSLTIRQVKV